MKKKRLLNLYTKEILQTWRTSRVGCFYLNAYTISRSNELDLEGLELAALELKTRPFEELLDIYHYIRREFQRSLKHSSSEEMKEKQGLLDHFHYYVLES